MKRYVLALGCAAAVLTAAAAAYAQDRVVIRHGGGPEIAFDADNDGWITRAEASAAADRLFAQLDENNDGRLTPADGEARRAERDAARAARHAEREARRAEREIERSERRAERLVERHVERLEGDENRTIIIQRTGGAHHPEPPEAPLPPRPPRPPMFIMAIANADEADLNGDGALSREEFRAQQLRFFDASDANGDSRIRFEPPPAPPEPPEPPTPPSRTR
ncbi:MAG TPA: hypothetical protein PLK37_05265 [Terricaulis sp.]|nr:hypothetical protein [Terricaulis sp.]